MYLIYLDIDGVLNVETQKSLRDCDSIYDSEQPSRVHISALNLISGKLPNTKIILSSSWRNEMSVFGWNRYFSALGIAAPVLDITPRFGSHRGSEILSSLIEIQGKFRKYVENNEPINGFLVLDDDYDYDYEFIKDHWYKVDFNNGLQLTDVDPALVLLKQRVNWPFK